MAAYRQAADLYRCLSGNERDQADCLYHVADILDTTGRQEEAASDYRRALDLYRGLPDSEQQASCLRNIGVALYAAGRYEDAMTAYREELDLYRGLPDSEQQQASCGWN